MKFIIRYLGIVQIEKELTPGEYIIGRSKDADFILTQDFISRKHGKIYFKDDKWWYQDLRENHLHFRKDPIELTKDSMIELENDIDLLTEKYLYEEITGVYNIKDLKSMAKSNWANKRRITFVAVFMLLSILGSGLYYGYHLFNKPMDPNTLFSFVRDKIVEFEFIKDETAINDFKQYAGLNNEDFVKTAGFCSGFIVAPNIVLTAKHCVLGQIGLNPNNNFQIKTSDGLYHKPDKILGFDIKRDYLFLNVPSLKKYGYLKMTDDYNIGETVYTVGNVAGEGIAIREGIMANKTKDRNFPEISYLRFSAAASPGNSGGPLIDGYGRVIGLVFARTMTENYNIATGADELLKGKKTFADNTKQKTITIDTKNFHAFDYTYFFELFGIYYDYAWMEYPELVQSLNELKFDITVPDTIASLTNIIYQKSNTTILEKIQSLTDIMAEKDRPSKKWLSQVTEKLPLIVPNNSDPIYYNHFIKADKNMLIEEYAGLTSPISSSAYKTFNDEYINNKKYNYYSEKIIANLPSSFDIIKSNELIYSTSYYNTKNELTFLNYTPHLFVNLDFNKKDNWDELRTYSFKKATKSILGEDGMLVSYLYSPFVRPKSFRPFTLKEINTEPQILDIKDGNGRTWQLASIPMFGTYIFDQYCLALPQGHLCLSKFFEAPEKILTEIIRKNTFDDYLSELIPKPIFFDVDAIIDFYNKGYAENYREYKDVIITKDSSGALTIELKTLGISYTFPKNKAPKMLKFIPALYKNNEENKWISLGFQGYFTENDKQKVCGSDIELGDINWSDTIQSREEIAKDKKIKTGITNLKLKNLDKKAKMFNYCYDVKSHDDRSSNKKQYSIENQTLFNMSYKVK